MKYFVVILTLTSSLAWADAARDAQKPKPTPPTSDFLYADAHNLRLMIEPEVGYATGNWKYNWGDSSFDGWTYGGRLGLDYKGFAFGGEYWGGGFNDDQNPTQRITANDFGAFLAYRFDETARLYVGYLLNTQVGAVSQANNHSYTGADFKVGLGMTICKPIALNIEYLQGRFDRDNGSAMGYSLKERIVNFAISWPMWFF